MPSQQAQHCPFLNRADARCGESFHLDKLDHAFHYCFGRYAYCPVYMELLVERKLRRREATGACDLPSEAQDAEHDHGFGNVHSERIIQVSVRRPASANRNAQQPTRGQGIPALPGV